MDATPTASYDPRQLAGPQRAAAILLAMGKPPATRLLKHLEPHELREVTRAAARLGSVPPSELETLVEEFTAAFSAGASLLGDVGKARDMLTDVAGPEEVAEILSEVSSPGDLGVWNALGAVPESVLQGYLANEHPLVATYILSKLTPALAAQIVARMPREARNEVLVAMIVRPVLSEDIQLIVEDAVRKDLGNLTARASGLDNHTRIADILSEVSMPGDLGVWNALGGVPEAVLQGYLANEHPLVATYILSKLTPPLAAQVVARMPREARNEVLVAMIVRPVLSEDIQLIIEDGVRKDLGNLMARGVGLDNHVRIADIINNLEPLDARDVVQSLVAARPKEARLVMKMLFSFDDLPRLSQRARAVLFDKLQTETVVMALRGADVEFREAVLSAMASRSKRLVESELATPMLASPRDIAKARKQITDLVLKMAQRNEIEIPPPDGAEAA